MEKNLPLYELFIDENDESGVDFIALVDEPAIQKGWKAFAAEKVSFDYDDTLNTPKGKILAKKIIDEGATAYVISASGDKNRLLPLATELGISSDKVFATGSNKAKVEKVKELGIAKHYDNNSDVVAELGSVGMQFVTEPNAGEKESDFISRCISVEVADGYDQEQASAMCYAKWDAKKTKMKFSADVEKRIISGPAMVPDQLIYRKDKDGNGYNVIFRADTIRKIVEKYFRNQNNGNFNLMHRKNLLAEGVYLIESMLIDEQRGIRTPLGFEKLKDGSWFISCKVENDQVWDEYVKTGVFTGFSVEGIFLEKKVSNANKQLDEVLSILAQIN